MAEEKSIDELVARTKKITLHESPVKTTAVDGINFHQVVLSPLFRNLIPALEC